MVSLNSTQLSSGQGWDGVKENTRELLQMEKKVVKYSANLC